MSIRWARSLVLSVPPFFHIATFPSNSIAFLFIGFRTDLLKFSRWLEPIALVYAAIFAARAVTAYPILTFFDGFEASAERKIPLKWRSVAMLGGMMGRCP